MASFLEARSRQGKWYLRIDDLDHYRIVKGATDSILSTLEGYQLHWDGEITFQSRQIDAYQAALEKLDHQGLIYPCYCSRKFLAKNIHAETDRHRYPGYCRDKNLSREQPHALRIRTENNEIYFHDGIHGHCRNRLFDECGDFIVKRRDRLFAYQLAVVVDDHEQQISHVLRGNDLLDSTPRQIYLQNILSIANPLYTHIPVITDSKGTKLSKQTGASAVTDKDRQTTLYNLLTLLHQSPPKAIRDADISDIIAWAICHWDVMQLKNQSHINLAEFAQE